MSTQRTRVLQRAEAPHPVVGLLDGAADPSQPPAPGPAPAKEPTQRPTPVPDPAPDRAKKQVNYRLDPSLIEELQKASIDYSFRQGQKFSQNRIVELALREWLDANGPWQH
ncbi:hypothetical protein [Mycobacterium intracellulare]|uniref:hypothetical protein n=1 Tax=Mycobacterium intracellulare TaxID=1767 RepID=UPI000A043507|nr:hypothetical protein [Mycobacterium intracellulare]UCN12889.1 hypothetical protein LFT50_28750 [Mycobacterium intracellulare subsp. chimaera]